MRGLIVAVVVAGVVVTFAFDAVFELFHRLFFPSGSYLFDPRTDHLVQLFPFDFWSETTLVLGGVIVVLAAVVAVLAGRRTRTGRSTDASVDVRSVDRDATSPDRSQPETAQSEPAR